jgi:hypothetical protein
VCSLYLCNIAHTHTHTHTDTHTHILCLCLSFVCVCVTERGGVPSLSMCVSMCDDREGEERVSSARLRPTTYIRIRQHTSAYVSIRWPEGARSVSSNCWQHCVEAAYTDSSIHRHSICCTAPERTGSREIGNCNFTNTLQTALISLSLSLSLSLARSLALSPIYSTYNCILEKHGGAEV